MKIEIQPLEKGGFVLSFYWGNIQRNKFFKNLEQIPEYIALLFSLNDPDIAYTSLNAGPHRI